MERVNRELVPIKAHYFLFNAATAPVVTFAPTIAKQLGFSGFLTGQMYSVLPISFIIAKPLFGALADKYRMHKVFFLIFQAVLAVGLFLIHFVPEVNVTAPVNMTCNAATFMEVCSKTGFSESLLEGAVSKDITKSKCHLSCNTSTNTATLQETYKEFCDGWKAKQYCNYNDSNPPNVIFDFDAGFSMNQDLPLARCLDVRLRNVTYSDGSVHTPYCDKQVRTSCTAECNEVPALKKLLQKIGSSSVSGTYQFHMFLWSAIVGWIGMGVVVCIADAICFDLLGEERQKEYGKQKMWGSIGFGIFCISTGYLVDLLSNGSIEKDYTCIFYLMLVVMIFDMLVSATLKKKFVENTESEASILWELGAVGREGRVLVFGFWCIGAGMCTGVVWNFLFWYTEELAKGPEITWLKTLQGLITGVQCFFGELPFNFLSGRVLKKLGHINVMSLVLLIYAVRFMAYSLISKAWLVLLVEFLHGPTWGLCWPTMVSYGDKVAPSGTRATMQGLVGAVFEGIGVACGSILCGKLMDTYGGVITFRIFSAGALVWLSIYWILQLLLRKAKAYPVHQGHNHLASYATPSDAILMTMSQELQTY